MRRLCLALGCSAWLAAPAASIAGEAARASFESVEYLVYRCLPDEVRLFWRDNAGQPIRQFARLQRLLEARGERLEFAMNAGIFEPDGTPSGLHVEDGRELLPLNTREGRGNFYLKPNGVFCIEGGKARILETDEYRRANLRPRLAVQSGPLLLRAGKVHPAFDKDSPSRLHRNGVGVDDEGRVVFAITKFDDANRVNLHGFAELFRSLGCRDALFLDGDLSMALVDPRGDAPAGTHFGAILAVTSPRSAEAVEKKY